MNEVTWLITMIHIESGTTLASWDIVYATS